MDIEDFVFGCYLTIIAILILALIGGGIYAIIQDNNNENNYQKCICENVKD